MDEQGDWKSRISVDPRVCHGQACIRGTRIMVWLIVQRLANGDTEEALLRAYPSLHREDIRAGLHYASALTRQWMLPVEAMK